MSHYGSAGSRYYCIRNLIDFQSHHVKSDENKFQLFLSQMDVQEWENFNHIIGKTIDLFRLIVIIKFFDVGVGQGSVS